MHRVFAIDEIFSMILSYLGDNLASLASVVRVCKAWYEAGMGRLWSRVNSLDFLPDDASFRGKRRGNGSLDEYWFPPRLHRLIACARRTKILDASYPPIHYINEDVRRGGEFIALLERYGHALDFILEYLHMHPNRLLPALTRLRLKGLPLDIVLLCTLLCGDSNLVSLDAADIPPLNTTKPARILKPKSSTFHQLARRVKAMRSFRLSMHHYPANYFTAEVLEQPEKVSDAAEREEREDDIREKMYRKYSPLLVPLLSPNIASGLEDIRIPAEKLTLYTLARLPRLKVLHVDICDDQDMFNRSQPNYDDLPHVPYPALEKLTVTILCDIEDGMRILEHAKCYPRTELHLDLRCLIFDDDLPDLVATLLNTDVNPGLRSFVMESRNSTDYGPYGFGTSLHTIQHLLAFRELEHLTVDFGIAMTLTNEDLGLMVEAWPRIRTLNLGSAGIVFDVAPDLLGLHTFANCPHLERLEILVDASLPQTGTFNPTPPSLPCPLTTLIPGDSTIQLNSAPEVARHLLRGFPVLRYVQAQSNYASAAREWLRVAQTIQTRFEHVYGESATVIDEPSRGRETATHRLYRNEEIDPRWFEPVALGLPSG